MRKIGKLTGAYLRYYKKQTITMLAGIMLSAALIAGIGSMIFSGKMADLESARQQNGDWHFQVKDDEGRARLTAEAAEGNGYKIEKSAVMTVKQMIEEPYQVTFCSADEVYMRMMNRTLIDGEYPKKAGEIALDYYSINNLGVSDRIGEMVDICGEEYTLAGILTDGCSDNTGDMKVFVSKDTVMDTQSSLVYLKFDESERVYEQMEAFLEQSGIKMTGNVARNNEVAAFVGGFSKESLLDTIKAAMSSSDYGIVYLLGSLNESVGIVDKVVFMALAFFGGFMMYSLYAVTAARRKNQYAILQVIGLEKQHLFAAMLTEILILLAVGYPTGCVVGNTAAGLIYSTVSNLFTSTDETAGFFVSAASMRMGAVCFCGFAVLISMATVRQMAGQTEAQMIKSGNSRRRADRKIHSLKMHDLTRLLTKRFMLGRAGMFVGIIVSLSLGGVIFLCTAYVAESTQKNQNHVFKTDEGLADDIDVYIDSADGSYTIPKSVVEKIRHIPGIRQADEMSYLLGEVPLENGIMKWTEYYPETSGEGIEKQDPRIIENYGGIIRQSSKDSFLVKVNVYGYTKSMMDALGDYLLSGEINSDMMRTDNSVILKTLTDGQGNTDGIDIGIGDTIRLKVPKRMDVPELLKFDREESEYIEKEFRVAGIVNRPLAKNDYFIGDNGHSQVDIIMTNEQMEANFGVNSYTSVSVLLSDGADSSKTAQKLKAVTNGIGRCMIRDNTELLKERNRQLMQKVYFFYGTAAILFCISLLHIMNSMKFIVLSRRHEWGIVRAMGITDRGFLRMLLREGVRYGVSASAFMMAVYLLTHRILQYVMAHVFRYIIVEQNLMLPECMVMAVANVAVGVIAVLAAGMEILREDIVKQIG